MDMVLSEHYRAVLGDLQERRSLLAAELEQLDASIAVLQRQGNLALDPPKKPDVSPTYSPRQLGEMANYSHMSVRWATLWYLSGSAGTARKTGDIAKALRDGGYPTTMGDRFSNSVSAVLSAMKTKGEVETTEDGAYCITDNGQAAWDHIMKSARFRLTQVA